MLWALLFSLINPSPALPSDPFFFTQFVDHFSFTEETFQQRYYRNDSSFGGPGFPIICIMGGEEAIEPTKGILYPSVVILAERLHAAIIEPEHRFFGSSLPLKSPYDSRRLQLLTPPQALADSATFIEAMRVERNCTGRHGEPRCPVITVGGSYPGWQAAMMRVRYPAVVDAAYSASPALGFYNQAVDPFGYYRVVTASAARASAGCPDAVRGMLAATLAVASKAAMVSNLNLCLPLPAYLEAGDAQLLKDELSMVFQYGWANLNMGNYPPGNTTRLYKACASVESAAPGNPWGALGSFFAAYSATTTSTAGCFNLSAQLPSGVNATISSGDWSGVGTGDDGSSWDFETCSYLVSPIGTKRVTDMFMPRAWSMDWLNAHCLYRFGITPQPRTLPDLWGTDPEALVRAGASRIVFTNGENDGWSVGGVQGNLSESLLVFNMPNGAHHSDLNYQWPSTVEDTEDVLEVRELVAQTLQKWIS